MIWGSGKIGSLLWAISSRLPSTLAHLFRTSLVIAPRSTGRRIIIGAPCNDGTAAPNLLVEFGDLLADVLALLGAPAMWPGKITPARRIAERLLSRPWYPS
jgi:hypothetical protein